jgi:hypothetical protein
MWEGAFCKIPQDKRRGASGCTDADVEWVKTVREGVAIEGETPAKAAWAKRAGSMGGGWGESWSEDGADDGGIGEGRDEASSALLTLETGRPVNRQHPLQKSRPAPVR